MIRILLFICHGRDVRSISGYKLAEWGITFSFQNKTTIRLRMRKGKLRILQLSLSSRGIVKGVEIQKSVVKLCNSRIKDTAVSVKGAGYFNLA